MFRLFKSGTNSSGLDLVFEARTSGSFWDTGIKGLEKMGLLPGSSGAGLRKVGLGGFSGED